VTLRIAVTRHGCFIDMRGAEVVHFVRLNTPRSGLTDATATLALEESPQ
jgi:hypothetical protein